MKRTFRLLGLLITLSLASSFGGVQADPSIVRHERIDGVPIKGVSPLTLIHSVPTETELEGSFSPENEASKNWRRVIDETKSTLDWAAFYVSNQPGSRLDLVLKAIRRAASRGVRVRLLADKGFYKIYPETLDSLDELDGILVKLIDYRELVGGPMHAKYFISDGNTSFIGSQNTDWRSLEHIFEMGMIIDDRNFATDLGNVFESDWKRSKGVGRIERWAGREVYPKRMVTTVRNHDDGSVWYRPAFSPYSDIADPKSWDLPQLVSLIKSAKETLSLTCLSYSPESRDGSYWNVIDTELRSAALRGVKVQLLVSDWNKSEPKIHYLKSLQHIPGVEVRMATIPQHSSGFIPFSRVIHAKFMTADGEHFWLGTSNMEKSYFMSSRNVGIVGTDSSLTKQLDASFAAVWNSGYAYTVDPCKHYEPPRVGQ